MVCARVLRRVTYITSVDSAASGDDATAERGMGEDDMGNDIRDVTNIATCKGMAVAG